MGNKNLLNMAMNGGMLMGTALIIVSLLGWILGLPFDHWINSTMTYIIIIGGLFYFIKNYRDNTLRGYISYGQVLGAGTLIGVCYGIIYNFYFWIYLMFLNTEAINMIKELAFEQSISMGQSEEQAIQSLDMMAFMYTPGGMAAMGFVSSILWSFIVALIMGIFLKKNNPNPFEGSED